MIQTVSLFSGGGGLDLGFQREGYEVIWANDVEKNAAATYRRNLGSHILCADINTVPLSALPPCSVVIGGPPCQSFSLAGNRNTEDARGRLVWKYLEVIDTLRPRAFVFENVTGLLSAKNARGERIIENLFLAFERIGYRLSWKVLNAADYGVPQRRKRLFLVGLRGNETFAFPAATHREGAYVTIGEAIDDLRRAALREGARAAYTHLPESAYQTAMRAGREDVSDHVVSSMSELDRFIIAHVRPGGNYMDIPPDVASARITRLQRDGGHTTCYGRMRPDEPAYTVNTYFNRPNVGCNIHYSEARFITVREALRLQSFPDDYEIVSTSAQGKRLVVGNAVPPLLAQQLARALVPYVETRG